MKISDSHKALGEPLDDEERELMDPATWDWDDPIEGIPTESPGLVFEIRLTREEVDGLATRARSEGVSLYTLIKRAIVSYLPQQAVRR